ncbi:MAG TPA: DegT/DnrJ/EryC1/StrS aminotransferase family protein [Candidatus Gallacutalibacter stercoravium]|nr:DegT/DnrJ/EryC1/StrS aminotransferase family protein [Candidatus Gallacutalibacter stercoravium]
MGYQIPFSPPDISDVEINEVVDTLRSGWITTGPKTKRFEQEIARRCGTSKAVCLNSATASMELTLRLLGIGPGDEVITTAYTYTATASVICHVGATPVLLDTAPGSFFPDYGALSQAITAKTKAVMPVDLGGVMCDYSAIYAALEQRKDLFCPSSPLQEALGRVAVVADAAHAFGASWQERPCGSVADFTCFSFHAVKNLTTAEGGAVTWRDIDGVDNEALYRQYMLFSLHGQSKDALAKTAAGAWEYDIAAPYYKCNMTDINAALGLGQLSRYDDLLARRRELIARYNAAFADRGLVTLPHTGSHWVSSGHLYLTHAPDRDEAWRNSTITALAQRGIAANVHYKPLPLLSAYRNLGYRIEDYPNAYRMYQSEITLPLHTRLTDQEADYVAENFCSLL